METDLTLIWGIIIAAAVFGYVVLDGFDLGIGMLFALFPARSDRDVMMNSVAPVWDGNETWLVLGGGGLFAAFPLAYSIIMPAVYAPLVAMLLALVFRGVAFEFRWRTERARWIWDLSFITGSLVAALSQGIILGAILQGIAVEGRSYAGGWWDWLTPFSVLTGLAVACGYMLLGATWLVMKTGGDLQEKARVLGWRFAVATVVFIGIVSLWTPFLQPSYFERWFEWPGIVYAVFVPTAVAAVAVLLFLGLRVHRREYRPFLLALTLFALSFVGLAVSMYPYIIPPVVTLQDAAAPEKSQVLMLIGVVILLPVIIAYTGWAYWVFRGKVDQHSGYH